MRLLAWVSWVSDGIQLWSQKALVTEEICRSWAACYLLSVCILCHYPVLSLGSLHMPFCGLTYSSSGFDNIGTMNMLIRFSQQPLTWAVTAQPNREGCRWFPWLSCHYVLELQRTGGSTGWLCNIYLEDKRSFRASKETMKDLRFHF